MVVWPKVDNIVSSSHGQVLWYLFLGIIERKIQILVSMAQNMRLAFFGSEYVIFDQNLKFWNKNDQFLTTKRTLKARNVKRMNFKRNP